MEKPGIWETFKKNLKFWTKITKKPGFFNNFYMFSGKIWFDTKNLSYGFFLSSPKKFLFKNTFKVAYRMVLMVFLLFNIVFFLL